VCVCVLRSVCVCGKFYERLLTAGIYTKSNEMFNKHFAVRKSQ